MPTTAPSRTAPSVAPSVASGVASGVAPPTAAPAARIAAACLALCLAALIGVAPAAAQSVGPAPAGQPPAAQPTLGGAAGGAAGGLGATPADGAFVGTTDGVAAGADVTGAAPGEEVAVIYAEEFQPIPVALPTFRAADPAQEDFAIKISEVISADLERSGYFRLIGAPALPSIDVPPRAPAWRSRGAEALIAGEVARAEDGRLAVRFRLWSLAGSEQLVQLQFLSGPKGWRRVAHKIADAVYTKLTGEAPYFDSRIVYVHESGPKNDRVKRLAIMDQDGANHDFLTDGAHLVLTPRFSPNEQVITYISYRNNRPEVQLFDLNTRAVERVGVFNGMTFAPRFSPNGDSVVMSIARGGGSDIFLMDLASGRTRALTESPSIDTSPSFHPRGDAIVFESDRGGGQQLYMMDPDGANVQRISRGAGRYATPVWSPTGDFIAFTKLLGGKFYIGVMTPDGLEERLLTSSFLDEGPTWAPNGRVLMFFREQPGAQGKPELYTVDIFGRALRRVPTPDGASDPAWSPLLQP